MSPIELSNIVELYMFNQDFFGVTVLEPKTYLSQESVQVGEPCPSYECAQVENLR